MWSLKNKVIHWLASRVGNENQLAIDILTVQRASWIGNPGKNYEEDCIKVHFRDRRVVQIILNLLKIYSSDDQIAVPYLLSYFYRPPPHTINIVRDRTIRRPDQLITPIRFAHV